MRVLLALLILLVPRLAAADCEDDVDCIAQFDLGWTCAASENNGLGVCYGPCAAGMEACGESTRYCITSGYLCCTVPGPPWGCPAEHTCGSTNLTCLSIDEDFGCVKDCSASGRDGASALIPLAGWGVIALVLFRRRRPR